MFKSKPKVRDFERGEADLSETIMSFQEKSLILGIAGGGEAGKTSVACSIAKFFGNDDVIVIKQDTYDRAKNNLLPEEQDQTNFDHRVTFDMDRLADQLGGLLAGREVMIPCYDCTTHCTKEKRLSINFAEVIIIEGMLIFTHERLRELMDLKIFLSVGNDIQQSKKTLDPVIDQYMEVVRPMHRAVVELGKQFADIIMTNWDNQDAVEMVITFISGLKHIRKIKTVSLLT